MILSLAGFGVFSANYNFKHLFHTTMVFSVLYLLAKIGEGALIKNKF